MGTVILESDNDATVVFIDPAIDADDDHAVFVFIYTALDDATVAAELLDLAGDPGLAIEVFSWYAGAVRDAKPDTAEQVLAESLAVRGLTFAEIG